MLATIEQFVDNNATLNVSNFIERIYLLIIDEYDDELFRLYHTSEQWIVSEYLGRQLKARGEIVESFCGHTIWGRKIQGQAIYMDKVIQAIYQEN